MELLMDSSNTASGGNPKLVLIALVLAVAAVVLVNIYISVMQSAAQPGVMTVFRLKSNVEPGEQLQASQVTEVTVPKKFEDVFSSAVKADEQGQPVNVGETFQRSAEMNDILTYELFNQPQHNRLDTRIDANKRGITLPVESQNLPAGLKPGMYVDIEAWMPAPGDGNGPRLMTVIERVKLLEVGEQSIVDQDQARTVAATDVRKITIQVDPQQATQFERIESLVARPFELHLRNPGDETTPKLQTRGINPQVLDLLNRTPRAAQSR
jgi:Flp pilus assembly protein CpaB